MDGGMEGWMGNIIGQSLKYAFLLCVQACYVYQLQLALLVWGEQWAESRTDTCLKSRVLDSMGRIIAAGAAAAAAAAGYGCEGMSAQPQPRIPLFYGSKNGTNTFNSDTCLGITNLFAHVCPPVQNGFLPVAGPLSRCISDAAAIHAADIWIIVYRAAVSNDVKAAAQVVRAQRRRIILICVDDGTNWERTLQLALDQHLL
jgi:hypothetical protein